MPLQQKYIDAFNVLGLTPDVDQATASKAYKKLALTHHPDRNHGDETATMRFQEIGKAWDLCLKYYENPESAEVDYAPSFAGYEFDPDGDFPMEEWLAEEFLKFMFEEMLRGRYSRDKGKRYRSQRTGGYGAHVYAFSSSFAERQAEARKRVEENNRRQREARQEYFKRVAELEAEIAADKLEQERLAKEQRRKESQLVTAYHTAFREGRSGNGFAMRQIVSDMDLDVNAPEKTPTPAKLATKAAPDAARTYETMLHVASAKCDVETVSFFLAKGASISALNNGKLTPFHAAVLHGNGPVVKLYLEHALKYPSEQGCHPSKAAANGKTVLQLAIASKSVEVIGAVVKYATVHDVDARWRELPIIISDEALVREIRGALLTKNGFHAPGSESPSVSMSKKALKKQAEKEQEEKAKEEKARRIAEEQARAEENRKKKEERKAKRDEEERLKNAAIEAARLEEERKAEEKRRAKQLEEERIRKREEEALRVAAEEKRKAAERERQRLIEQEQRQAVIIAKEKAKRDEELRKKAEWKRVRREQEEERQRRADEEERQRQLAEAQRLAELTRIEQERLAAERWAQWEADQVVHRLAEEARLRAEAEAAQAARQAQDAEAQRQMETEDLRQQIKALQASSPAPSSSQLDTALGVCPYFKRGNCRFGRRCRLQHVPREKKESPVVDTPAVEVVEKEQKPKVAKKTQDLDDDTKRRRAEQSAKDKARAQLEKEQREKSGGQAPSLLAPQVKSKSAPRHPQQQALPSPPMTPEDLQTCPISDELFPREAPPQLAGRAQVMTPPISISEESSASAPQKSPTSPVYSRGRVSRRGGAGRGRGRSFDDHQRTSKGNLQKQLAEKDQELRRMAAELAALKGEN